MRKRRPPQRVWLTFARLNVVALTLVVLIVVADWTQSRALALVVVIVLGILMLLRPWGRHH